MSNFNVNINVDEILTQKDKETFVPTKTVFNEKNYLQARLAKGETSKELTIRLLPFSPDGGSPFKKIYMHVVKVNKEVSQSGWKTFPCPTKNHLGEKCPFCMTSEQARDLKGKALNEIEKKKYNEMEYTFSAKEWWVVRCIERGHEDEGVKFWIFPHSKKRNGVWDKIINIFQTRYNKSIAQGGPINNIFDLNDGKDLIISLSKDQNDKTAINITDDDSKRPLSTDYELAESWLNDTKKWNEVYTVKSFDYMSIIVGGGVPVFSKEENKYIDKSEKEKKDKEEKEEIENNLSRNNVDLSTPTQIYGNDINVNNNNISYNSFDEDDDIPF